MVRAARRAGKSVVIKPRMKYSARYVRNAVEGRTNGVMHTLTIYMEEGVRLLSEAYLSPPVSADETERVLQEILKESSEKYVVVGDLNARHYIWDTTSNAKDRFIVRGTQGNRYHVRAPGEGVYKPKGRPG